MHPRKNIFVCEHYQRVGRTQPRKYVRLFDILKSGSAEAAIDGVSVARLDATNKEALVDVQLLAITHARAAKLFSSDGLGVLGALGLPATLSKKGWRLTLVNQGRNVVVMGSGVSSLTGHVSANLPELLRLRKLFRL